MSEAAENLDTVDDGVLDQPEAPEGAIEPEAEAPDGEQQPEPKKTDQDKINEAINRQAAKRFEAENRAKEADRKREEAEAELRRLQTPERPEVPEMPDPYDADFEGKVKARDAALLAQAQYDARQEAITNQNIANEQESQRQR